MIDKKAHPATWFRRPIYFLLTFFLGVVALTIFMGFRYYSQVEEDDVSFRTKAIFYLGIFISVFYIYILASQFSNKHKRKKLFKKHD